MKNTPIRLNTLLGCLFLIVCLMLTMTSKSFAQRLPVVFAKNAIAAQSAIAAEDLELQLNAPNLIPVDSFGDFEQVVGQTAKVDIPAGSLVTRAMVSVEERMSISGDQNIYSIPVSVRSEFKVGDRVKIVVFKEGQEEVILENVMVFHMGPPETDVVDEKGQPLFVRYVSVVVGTTQAAEALPKLRVKNKAFTLIPIGSNDEANPERVEGKPMMEKSPTPSVVPQASEGSSTRPVEGSSTRSAEGSSKRPVEGSSTRKAPLPIPTLPTEMKDTSINFDFEGLSLLERQRRLRDSARVLDRHASDLEDQKAYEKADLLRDAAQSLRKAARIPDQ